MVRSDWDHEVLAFEGINNITTEQKVFLNELCWKHDLLLGQLSSSDGTYYILQAPDPFAVPGII
jgi:hypothetical protein